MKSDRFGERAFTHTRPQLEIQISMNENTHPAPDSLGTVAANCQCPYLPKRAA